MLGKISIILNTDGLQCGKNRVHKSTNFNLGCVGRQKEQSSLWVQPRRSPNGREPFLNIGSFQDSLVAQKHNRIFGTVVRLLYLALYPVDVCLELVIVQAVRDGIGNEVEEGYKHRGDVVLVFGDPGRRNDSVRKDGRSWG